LPLALALEAEDPTDSPLFGRLLQPEERAAEMVQRADAALAAMGPLQPDTEERAMALQGLQWTAQRLKRLGLRLGAAEQVRQLYRSAFIAAASPRAVSQRLLRAVDVLEKEAQALEELRIEWHALWRRERDGPYDPETEAAMRRPIEVLRERAVRLQHLRDRYIQTGNLPSPAEEGLELPGARLAEGIIPTRLPPQPSPAWWPEGGAARLRVEVDCGEPAAGMPWEVQADFRALAGEAGAFNVRSARLVTLTETDEAGEENPCQLLRGGFAFVPEPGHHTYFLYLDPEPGPEHGFRETRAGQSRAGGRLENRRMQLRISPADGRLSGWRLLEQGLELLPEPTVKQEPPSADWRLRVLETGPLLARARAEHPDGHIRQFDVTAGQPWTEVSVNAPWTEFLLPLRPDPWGDGAAALYGGPEGVIRRGLLDQEEADVHWAVLHRVDGLTVALLSDSACRAQVAPDGLRLWGEPQGTNVVLFAGWEGEPEAALGRLWAARREPPKVRLGVIEERRVREF
jgi:hypothetical protein